MVKYAAPDAEAVAATAGTVTSPERFGVTRMARLLEVSTSGFYQWCKRRAATELTDRQQRRADLTVKILDAHADSDGTYGSPRITTELRERGEVVNEKTVAKIMAEIGIEGISPRTFKVRTTVVDPAASFPPDLVARVFDQGRPDAVWTTDFTYLSCGEGDMYLCAIRDGHTRRVLGHAVADHIGADVVEAAIEQAVAVRGGDTRATILHSDRGGEFTAGLTARACARHGLRRSMGATGICWDNSPSESLWSTFKHEFYYRHTFTRKTELVAAVDKWVNWYNTTRRHSAIGGISPVHYEQSLLTVSANAA
jgi:transposase InsO family protein